MPVMVALLRGINVGGRTTLPMADLRAVATDLGDDDVRTYIQSGNLLFRTGARPATVARDLERAVAALGGVAPSVVVRSRDELARVVDDNPYLPDADPSHLHVVFTSSEPASLPTEDLDRFLPERATVVGREVHLLLPNGVGRSKLAEELARRGGKDGTMRSWRTVTKLLELADEMARATAGTRR
jgi:uncharacterized protein (DUF1697 family)